MRLRQLPTKGTSEAIAALSPPLARLVFSPAGEEPAGGCPATPFPPWGMGKVDDVVQVGMVDMMAVHLFRGLAMAQIAQVGLGG